jgi:hypothetical protein
VVLADDEPPSRHGRLSDERAAHLTRRRFLIGKYKSSGSVGGNERICCFLLPPFLINEPRDHMHICKLIRITRGALAHLSLANWIVTKRVDGVASSSGTWNASNCSVSLAAAVSTSRSTTWPSPIDLQEEKHHTRSESIHPHDHSRTTNRTETHLVQPMRLRRFTWTERRHSCSISYDATASMTVVTEAHAGDAELSAFLVVAPLAIDVPLFFP